MDTDKKFADSCDSSDENMMMCVYSAPMLGVLSDLGFCVEGSSNLVWNRILTAVIEYQLIFGHHLVQNSLACCRLGKKVAIMQWTIMIGLHLGSQHGLKKC